MVLLGMTPSTWLLTVITPVPSQRDPALSSVPSGTRQACICCTYRHAGKHLCPGNKIIFFKGICVSLKCKKYHLTNDNGYWCLYYSDKYKCPPHADFYPESPRLKFLASFVRIFKGQGCLDEHIGLVDFIKYFAYSFE